MQANGIRMIPHPRDGHNVCFRSGVLEFGGNVWEDEGTSLDFPPNELQCTSRRRMCQAPHRSLTRTVGPADCLCQRAEGPKYKISVA